MTHLTRKQRAEVVELLRCAADGQRNGPGLAWAAADLGYVDFINPCSRVYSLACDAYMQISGIPSEWYWVNWRRRRGLLEAALRVEQGLWP